MKTATYRGFDGQTYSAVFGIVNDLGVPSLKITNVKGRTIRHVIMNENEAEGFFLNLSRDPS